MGGFVVSFELEREPELNPLPISLSFSLSAVDITPHTIPIVAKEIKDKGKGYVQVHVQEGSLYFTLESKFQKGREMYTDRKKALRPSL